LPACRPPRRPDTPAAAPGMRSSYIADQINELLNPAPPSGKPPPRGASLHAAHGAPIRSDSQPPLLPFQATARKRRTSPPSILQMTAMMKACSSPGEPHTARQQPSAAACRLTALCRRPPPPPLPPTQCATTARGHQSRGRRVPRRVQLTSRGFRAAERRGQRQRRGRRQRRRLDQRRQRGLR